MTPSAKQLRECFEPNKDKVIVSRSAGRIELRIGEPKRGQTRIAHLTLAEALKLGCALIALSEELKPSKREVVPHFYP
jgi:hypothetical protein